MFDMIDIDAEIERAKSTLEAADCAFQRHATKFDNEDPGETTMTDKFNRSRKMTDAEVEVKQKPSGPFKWSQVCQADDDIPLMSVRARKARINSLVSEMTAADPPSETRDLRVIGRSMEKGDKRKKSVSF
ncbi:uncharacterized protein LOC105693604 [Athalia rosae]|uniref:uncharacterized protein LOC105693604 n=1 Tax=Athalia rosae TaxID=37344 RepID=UPI0020346BC4|nr:uncharacterized protein LOC105693604 [Athalia rosae]